MSGSLYRLLFILALFTCQFSLVLHQQEIEHHANTAIDEATIAPPAILPASFIVSCDPMRQVARSPPVSALHA
jgi:hypothetical protein